MNQSKEIYKIIQERCPKCGSELLGNIFYSKKKRCIWTNGCDYKSKMIVKQLELWT